MRPGIWSLIQVPGGGEIRVPVKEEVKPVSFFGTPVFTIKKNVLTTVVKTDKSFKLSLKALHTKGVLIYFHAIGEKAVLVVRKFHDGDDSLYADYPSFNPADSGYCAEVYVDDGAYGGFGELEYHSKAINIDSGESETEDQSETWGFSGTLSDINNICENILKNL